MGFVSVDPAPCRRYSLTLTSPGSLFIIVPPVHPSIRPSAVPHVPSFRRSSRSVVPSFRLTLTHAPHPNRSVRLPHKILPRNSRGPVGRGCVRALLRPPVHGDRPVGRVSHPAGLSPAGPGDTVLPERAPPAERARHVCTRHPPGASAHRGHPGI